MFNCYEHGWSHIKNPCPLCNPVHTYTSSSTEYLLGVNGRHYEDLKKKLAIAIEALDKIKEIETQLDLADCSSGLTAIEALAKIKEIK
jgi:hypothetical protein